MLRRFLLSTLAMVPALSVLGCATSSTTPSQLATDVNLIASGLAAAIASIQQIPGVASTTLTQLQADLTTIQADAAQVASAPATSVVQAIGQAVQAVAALVLPLVPGGSSIEVTVQAALSLLPEIMAAAGVSGATTTPKFTPEQARLILAAAH